MLTKKDKADNSVTEKWVDFLSRDGSTVIAIDLVKEDVSKILIKSCKNIVSDLIERQKRKGIRPRAIRAMVVGVPNVGKSTMINRLAKRKAAKVADKPGVTRSLQWVNVNNEIELLDTPGVLWPKFEREEDGFILAITGAIRNEVIPLEEISRFALEYLYENYKNNVQSRFNVELCDDVWNNFEIIGRKRGFLASGNNVDLTRTMQTLVTEIRNDSLGNISWELPCENE